MENKVNNSGNLKNFLLGFGGADGVGTHKAIMLCPRPNDAEAKGSER